MERQMKNRMRVVAILAALGIGFAGAAHAAPGDANPGMPTEQQQNDVAFVSGGIGLDESRAMRADAQNWPLELQFTGPGGDYLANVRVSITAPQGADVLHANSRGPYMLVRLTPGHYVVHATYKDTDQMRSVVVSNGHHATVPFYWNEQ
jgi:ABC-type glycerol-3-phosphate transport system substrate-binding protein